MRGPKRGDILAIDSRGNHHIRLNPCIGCVSRGKCDKEQYADPDSYCRSYERKVK